MSYLSESRILQDFQRPMDDLPKIGLGKPIVFKHLAQSLPKVC